jgi:hypothetical protein
LNGGAARGCGREPHLRVVVGDEDRGAAHVVHGGVEELHRPLLSFGRQLAVGALAPVADDESAQENALNAARIGLRVRQVRRVAGVAGEVHAWARGPNRYIHGAFQIPGNWSSNSKFKFKFKFHP